MLMLTNHNGREREACDWINIFKQTRSTLSCYENAAAGRTSRLWPFPRNHRGSMGGLDKVDRVRLQLEFIHIGIALS
jgi:hypothetical protein